MRKDFFPPRPKRFRKKKGHKKQKDRQVKNENILTNLQTYISSQCQGTLLLEKDECNGPKPQLCLDFKNIKVPDSVNNSSFECDKRNESKSEIDKVCANATSDDECLNVYETQGKKRVHESDIDDESVSTKKAKSSLEETDENVNNKKLILSENFEKQRFLGVNMDNVSSDDISFSQPMFSSIECEVQPISKSMSDPGVQISKDDIDLHKLPHKLLTDNEEDSLHKPELSDDDNLEKKDSKRDSDSEMCITCLIEPKSGVFVHGRIAHICCCYKCSIQVWVKTKRCPVCNCRVSNVLRAFVV